MLWGPDPGRAGKPRPPQGPVCGWGLEARRDEEPVCLRLPQNVRKHLRAAHFWSEGLMLVGLSGNQGIRPLNSERVDFPQWGHCRGRHVEL